jgi:hypothetical protein
MQPTQPIAIPARRRRDEYPGNHPQEPSLLDAGDDQIITVVFPGLHVPNGIYIVPVGTTVRDILRLVINDPGSPYHNTPHPMQLFLLGSPPIALDHPVSNLNVYFAFPAPVVLPPVVAPGAGAPGVGAPGVGAPAA